MILTTIPFRNQYHDLFRCQVIFFDLFLINIFVGSHRQDIDSVISQVVKIHFLGA
jgi:hypothetical protein